MVTQRTQTRVGPPVGRHVAAVGLTSALTLALFFWFGGEVPLTHVVMADVSLVLLCLILLLGALARVVPRLRPVVPWGRELGIAMFVTAGLHTAMFIGPGLDVIGWFDGLLPEGGDASIRLWVGAQWLGLGALVYAAALASTSNDWSQRFLGRGWKFLQRQAYTLLVLAWLHTAAFLFFGAGHDAALPVWLFLGITGAAVIAQLVGFGHTVLARRPPSQHRVPAKAQADQSDVRTRSVKWAGVVALWAVFIAVSWLLSTVESGEERREALVCDRYNELQRPVLSQQIRRELEQILEPDGEVEAGAIFEALEVCDE